MTTELKIGMVGLDTSHCEAFAKILHDESYSFHLPGAKIVGIYPGGSRAFSKSWERVQGFTDTLQKNYGAQVYASLPALAAEVDAIFLESVDGRQHAEQFAQLAVGKPIFIDKPFTTATADARAILSKAEATQTPIMSCSSLRYAAGIADLVSPGEQVLAAESFGPAVLLEDFPGLFWYGIHSAEILITLMGAGCQQVQCVERAGQDVVIGEWRDGRIGVLRGTRAGAGQFGAVAHTENTVKAGVAQAAPPSYYLMLQQVLPFLQNGQSPIPLAETYEITAFLEAAERSRAAGGKVTPLEQR
ncbi:MAG: Gfo/Idh/MocA family oxidoreductase [Caldilineaceae bacterium]|nr:Gfo/Idh/MocA family oxidoreductase [Caldilineaceae bacterium]